MSFSVSVDRDNGMMTTHVRKITGNTFCESDLDLYGPRRGRCVIELTPWEGERLVHRLAVARDSLPWRCWPGIEHQKSYCSANGTIPTPTFGHSDWGLTPFLWEFHPPPPQEWPLPFFYPGKQLKGWPGFTQKTGQEIGNLFHLNRF